MRENSFAPVPVILIVDDQPTDTLMLQEAVAVLDEILNGSGDLIVRRSLESGEGLICANVPHRRDAFIDSRCVSERRLMYRGRYTSPLRA